MRKQWVGILILLMIWFPGFTQVTKIMGRVTDAQTKEPIPFVNILIRGTTIGTLSDFEGNYALEFKANADSIRATLIGFEPQTRAILKHQFQTIDFVLSQNRIDLPEVTIKYSGNPAERILQKVIDNKEKNTLYSFNTYQYEAYTKIEIDANNISEKFQQRRIMRPFQFMFNYLDTSTINGKTYLPVFLTETVSDIYFRKNPRSRKEIIKASKISGLENESVSQFLGNLSEQIDVYKNYIPFFEKNFVSPVANFGIDYYKYYLVDSLFISKNWCYHIMFKPRRKQELTFTGNLWITDTSFAVKKVEMKIADDANINFVNDMAVRQEYEWTDNAYWMLSKDELIIDFNIIENSKRTLGFFGHRTISYRNFLFDPPETKRFLSLPANVFIEPEAQEKNSGYWDTARHDELTTKEKHIYAMVDSIKNVPIFRTYTDIVYTIFNGYLPWGYVELGPYSKLFSFNQVEGTRFRFGARTSNRFSKKVQLEAYLAYGTKDQRFKYGGEVIYMFNKNPRRLITANYKYDVEQLGLSPTAFSSDNLLATLFYRGPNNKLTLVREYKLNYEHEWFNGLTNKLWFIHREVFPLEGTQFVVYPSLNEEPVTMNDIYTSEIRLDTRISFRERFVSGEFYRYTLSSPLPIILFSYSYGIPNLFKSDYEYHKVSLNVQQWFNFATIGWSKYIIEAGAIWGRLPYPLLKLHEGNQTFFYDEYSASLMNYYEFVSDRYISAIYTHHFDGLLFNKVPLLRKLKWREVAHVRCVYGTLEEKNRLYSQYPAGLRSFGNIPYWEAGVGIENILRIIRIDAVWRLSHRDDALNPHVATFGIFASLFFQF